MRWSRLEKIFGGVNRLIAVACAAIRIADIEGVPSGADPDLQFFMRSSNSCSNLNDFADGSSAPVTLSYGRVED